MKIIKKTVIRGANLWSSKHHQLLVVSIQIDSSKLTGNSYSELIISKVKKLIPEKSVELDKELLKFEAEPENPNLLLALLIAFLSHELQKCINGIFDYRRVRLINNPDNFKIVINFEDEKLAVSSVNAAIRIISGLLKSQNYSILPEREKIKSQLERRKIGPLTGYILNEAIKRGIPYFSINDNSIIQLGTGSNQKRIQKSFSGNTSYIAVKLSSNKDLTKKILSNSGIPTPHGKVVNALDDLSNAIEMIGYPLAIKPLSGSNGKGVSVNINNIREAKHAYKIAISNSVKRGGIVVEKYISGSDYRLLVINYKFVAGVLRTPARVIGDGKSTLQQLIEIVNSDPKRGLSHEKPLTFIKVDEETNEILSRKSLTIESVLGVGEILLLKSIANISAGGTPSDVTDIIHPDNKRTAERIAMLIGLDICGMDIIANDISIPFDQNNFAVIEVNSAPGIRLHMEPFEGKPRNVAGDIVDMLFPFGKNPLTPIISVTGCIGTSKMCSSINRMFLKFGKNSSYTASGEIHIQNVNLKVDGKNQLENIEILLKDPTTDIAIIESTPSNIINSGLGVIESNLSIVLNLEAENSDYIKINSQRLIKALKISPASVGLSGYSILNADDNQIIQFSKGLRCKIAYFSISGNNPIIINQIINKGIAAYIKDKFLYIFDGFVEIKLINIESLGYDIEGKNKLDIQILFGMVLTGMIFHFKPEVILNFLKSSRQPVLTN